MRDWLTGPFSDGTSLMFGALALASILGVSVFLFAMPRFSLELDAGLVMLLATAPILLFMGTNPFGILTRMDHHFAAFSFSNQWGYLNAWGAMPVSRQSVLRLVYFHYLALMLFGWALLAGVFYWVMGSQALVMMALLASIALLLASLRFNLIIGDVKWMVMCMVGLTLVYSSLKMNVHLALAIAVGIFIGIIQIVQVLRTQQRNWVKRNWVKEKLGQTLTLDTYIPVVSFYLAH